MPLAADNLKNEKENDFIKSSLYVTGRMFFIASMNSAVPHILEIPCWNDLCSSGGVVKDLQCLKKPARLVPLVGLL